MISTFGYKNVSLEWKSSFTPTSLNMTEQFSQSVCMCVWRCGVRYYLERIILAIKSK